MNQRPRPAPASAPTAAAAPAPAPLGDALAVGVVAGATWRELARRRRLLSLGFLLLLPVLLLISLRIFAPESTPPQVALPLLARYVYIWFLLPITAMAVGAPAIAEPIAEGTLVYFWTRPLRRHALYLGRILAATIVSCGLVLLSQTAVFAVLLAGWTEAIDLELVRLHVEMTFVTLLGTLAYTTLFGAFGAGLKRPMVASVLVTFGWEWLVADIPQRIQEWTLQFHLRNLVHWPEQEGTQTLDQTIRELINQALQREAVPAWQSVATLLAISLVATVAGVLLLRRRQLDRQG